MRAPLEWIRHYVDVPDAVGTDQIADAFVRVGLEVEALHTVPPTVGPLVVGSVRTIDELTGFKKPIRFCTVDVGAGYGPGNSADPRGIICGATNFVIGDKVVVALPGTVLPGGFAIASRPTYGHISDGMICSARELGIGTEHDGILVVDPDAAVGSDARGLIHSDDTVIEFAITADRGYALSIRGLARDLAAALDAGYTDVAGGTPRAEKEPARGVRIDDPTGCSRFVAVAVNGVDPAAPSPFWLRRRLAAAGIRPISLAVDVTNYVMLEYGQPLHAFDAGTLTGDIVVRRATEGEKLRTLDGQGRVLTADDMVVADSSGAISLAGVMGGESTEISTATTDVLIEAANWDPPMISRTVRRHRLPSEASRRFERGVDPQVAPIAAEAAAALLTAHGGGRIGGRTDVGEPAVPSTITLPAGEAERLAGREYGDATVQRLTQVGCAVAPGSGQGDLLVVPPSWRPDLTRPADLVEEIARLEGYDTIEPVLPAPPAGTGWTATQRRNRRVATDLASAGLIEVLSFPFAGPADLMVLGIPETDIRWQTSRLVNPLDPDRPLMQTTLLPGLLATAVRNLSRGARDLALFEIGQVVLPRDDAPRPPKLGVHHRPTQAEQRVLFASVPDQPRHVAAVLAGDWERSGWWGGGRAANWSDATGLARRIGTVAGVTLQAVATDLAPWHPGRCASIRLGDWPLGHAGELHPAVIERLGLPPRTVALELNLDGMGEPAPPTAPRISTFPPVHLDVALVLAADVPAASVAAALRAGGGPMLESVRLFDVYSGDQVGEGSKSMAFALVVRASDRTLTAAEAVTVRDAAVAAAGERVGAVLRA